MIDRKKLIFRKKRNQTIKLKNKNFGNKIENSDNKPKSTNTLKRNTKSNHSNISFKFIVNYFYNFFINATPILFSNFKNISYNCNIEFNNNSLEMHLTDIQEIFDIIKNFKNKHSCSYD